MELKARFTERNQVYGYGFVIGEKNFGEIEESVAHKEAQKITNTLSDVRNTEVSYVLEDKNKNILVYI